MTFAIPPLARPGLRLATVRRTDEDYLAAAWADPATLVLPLAGTRALVTEDAGQGPRLVLVPTDQAPAGERYFLGTDEADVAYFAVRGTSDAAPAAGGPRGDGPVRAGPGGDGPGSDGRRAAGLREIGALLPARDAALLVHAVALRQWHDLHPHCARCGAATEAAAGGHLRRCPACGAEHFPRTDPAVIMLVTDAQDRALLGRGAHWPPLRYSTLAGFVEPGESLEQAVVREVAEETGVRVGEVSYLGSQPWPFPSSLMLGFTARASDDRITVDGTEISDARWFSRAELRGAVDAGELRLPGAISIAHHLLEHWYGEPLPGGW
jgi:NAD+ diphosphatase